MSDQQTQNYSNHARWHPPFHYFTVPALFIHLIYSIARLWGEPTLDRVDGVLLAVAILALAVLARTNALKAQDRTIRLEELLRYSRVLSPDVAARASKLPERQIIALRFAPDAELPGLVEKTLSGQFKTGEEIKQAIVNWRGDYFRV